jgi:DNA-binding XRE family transcriptional regulator
VAEDKCECQFKQSTEPFDPALLPTLCTQILRASLAITFVPFARVFRFVTLYVPEKKTLMTQQNNRRTRSHLYSLRRNRGLRQKHLARLLGYRGTTMVSRLEAGASLPSLKVGMMLEISVGAKLSEVYVDLYHQLESQVLARCKHLPEPIARQVRNRIKGTDA